MIGATHVQIYAQSLSRNASYHYNNDRICLHCIPSFCSTFIGGVSHQCLWWDGLWKRVWQLWIRLTHDWPVSAWRDGLCSSCKSQQLPSYCSVQQSCWKADVPERPQSLAWATTVTAEAFMTIEVLRSLDIHVLFNNHAETFSPTAFQRPQVWHASQQS